MNVTRTIYAARLQTAIQHRLPIQIAANTTLNEKLDIQKSTSISSNDIPVLQYVAIGNGGHNMLAGANAVAIPQPIQHRPNDAALYNQLPFVMRTTSNDLTSLERTKYRLRKLVTYNGIDYIAYYMKLLDFTNVSVDMTYNTVSNGVTTTTPFVPTLDNLSPIPPAISNTGVVTTTGDYLSSTAKIPFVMTTADVNEFINVANIVYNNPNYAIISEVALCTGVDHSVTSTIGGAAVTYTEVIGAQVATFINAFFAMQFSNTGIDFMFDCGATEPLLVTA